MYKVIFIDDEFVIREKIKKLITWKDYGFELVNIFEDGKDAIEFLKNNNVDLIITDINMVFISGIDLAKYVYENHIDSVVVFLSAFDELEYAKKAIKYGVKAYINKPIFTKELKEELRGLKKSLDEKSITKEVFNFYLFTDYFAGISMGNNSSKRELLSNLDFRKSRFCIFNIELINCEISEKLIMALYNIFILENKDMHFCVLDSDDNNYTILIIFESELQNDWDKKYVEDVEKFINHKIKIVNKNFFDVASDIKKYWTSKEIKKEKDMEHIVIKNAKEYINNNLNKSLTLEEISEKLYISSYYLSKFFKKTTNINLGTYITECRIKKAEELLVNTNLAVYEIMEKVGYNNLPHFHSIFKKINGVAPKQFRNRVK